MIIIIVHITYILYMYYISNKGLLDERYKEANIAVTAGCYCFVFKRKTVKLSAQCHVFAQSPPNGIRTPCHPARRESLYRPN